MGFEKLKEKRRGKYKRKENSRESGRIREEGKGRDNQQDGLESFKRGQS
jgi:hypothetical protein